MYMCMCMCLCSEQFNKNRHPVFSLCNNKTMEGHNTKHICCKFSQNPTKTQTNQKKNFNQMQ